MRGGLNEADRHDRADVVGRKSIETRSGSHQGTGQLADYYPLIFKAVIRLEPNTTETRGKTREISVTFNRASGMCRCPMN
jgi:hypothetical protein